MEKLKSRVDHVISKRGDLTIDDICRELNFDDDFPIATVLGLLTLEGKVINAGEIPVYRSTGAAILVPTYGRPSK